jgi:hypothetical protein
MSYYVRVGAEELEMYVRILLKRSKVCEALSLLDSLSARNTGESITENLSFATDGSLVKLHALQLSNLRKFKKIKKKRWR